MEPLLLNFEQITALGPTRAAKLLGHPYSTYAQYRSGRRSLPTHAKRHIVLIMSLPEELLNAHIKEHVYGPAKQA